MIQQDKTLLGNLTDVELTETARGIGENLAQVLTELSSRGLSVRADIEAVDVRTWAETRQLFNVEIEVARVEKL